MATVIAADNSIQMKETIEAQSLLDTNTFISAKPSLTFGETPVTTNSADISQAGMKTASQFIQNIVIMLECQIIITTSA